MQPEETVQLTERTSGSHFTSLRHGLFGRGKGRAPRRFDGFESVSHRTEFADCLRRHYLPLKFAYTGSAAYTHDRLSRSSGYQSVIGPVHAEAKLYAAAVEQFGAGRQVIEIGPGNGVHSQAFFERLGELDLLPEHYLALDFSGTLLGLARAVIEGASRRPARIDTGLWDVEGGPSDRVGVWRSGPDPVIACFFGNTIGNVENPVAALSNIAQSLKSGDVLVMSTTLLPERATADELLGPYRTEVFHAAVLEVFKLAGIDRRSVRLEIVFEDGAACGIVECLEPVEFDGVRLRKGDSVRCFTSRRFNALDVQLLLNKAGWVVRTGSDSGDHYVVIAERK